MMNVDYTVIGKRIQQKRRELHKTQEQLAEALTVTVGYVSQIERGATKISLDRLSEIARWLGCNLTSLLSDAVPQSDNYLYSDLEHLYRAMNSRQRRLFLLVGEVLRCADLTPDETDPVQDCSSKDLHS